MAHAERGDLIVDVDRLFEALSGLEIYDTPDELLPFVLEARNAAIRRLTRRHKVKRAWIVTCGAKSSERQTLRRNLRAEVVILAVSEAECVRRIKADVRRKGNHAMWEKLVREWWAEYRAMPGEIMLVAGGGQPG